MGDSNNSQSNMSSKSTSSAIDTGVAVAAMEEAKDVARKFGGLVFVSEKAFSFR